MQKQQIRMRIQHSQRVAKDDGVNYYTIALSIIVNQ